MKRNATEQERKIFSYLNKLRESGKINMFLAAPFICSDFPSIPKNEARKILSLWMSNFQTLQKEYTEIEDKGLN